MPYAALTLISTNLTGSAGFDGREALCFTFSEPIQTGTGWVSIHRSDGTLVERFDIATSSQVSLSGMVLTITPTWALESSAEHYITIDAGAVRDADGNGYAGLTAAQPLSFRTGAESLNNTVEEPFRNNFPNNDRETIGEHSFLYVRTTFADQLNVPWSEWTWRQDDAVVEEYWALNSNGRVSITSAFAPLATLERTTDWYADLDTAGSGINGIKYNNVGWLWEEGLNSAFAYSGYDFANFDAGVVGNDDWARYGASFGGGRLVLNAWTGWEVLAHEAGHELGFGHPGQIATPFGGTVGYEGYSRMGGGSSHYHLWEKNGVGWIDPSQILTDPQAGNYRIAAFDRGYTFQSDINLLSFKGAATGSTPAYDWSVQYRSLVNEVSDSLLVFRGSNDRLNDPIRVGETFRVPNGNAYITTLSKGDGYLETAVRYGLVATNGSSLDNIAPVVSFTANASAVKAGESATFNANAYDADGNALTYTWSFSDGVSGQGASFTRSFNQSTAGTVTAVLTANDLRGGSVSTSATIAVGAAARDTTPLSAGGPLPAAATRSKPLVTLQSRDAFADENGDTATLVLERFGTSLDGPLTVALSYSGSGINDVTSGSKPATISFTPGQKSVEFQVSLLDDAAVESVERLTISLAASSDYDISASDGSSWVSLYDNDLPKVRVEAIDAVASEGGRDFGTFLISRSGPLDAALKVNYNQFGTALHGSDYAALSGEVTIAAGQRSAVVMIQPIDNDAGEPIEYVSLILPDFSDQYDVDPTAFIAKIAILDNDKPQVQAYVERNGSTEGETASVTIEAQGQIGSTVTVRYALSGTATAGSDYTAPSGSVNVVIGQDGIGWASVAIPLIDDTTAESQETVVLTILESEDYGIGTDRKATIVVRDNDSTTPVVMISPLPDSATEGSANSLRFYIERSGTSGNLVVNYQLLGSATAGVDYSGLSGSVTIADGQPGAIITATPINDSLAEGEETITVRLLPSATYQLGIANTATLAISDDEPGVFGVGFYLPKQETQWLLVEGAIPALMANSATPHCAWLTLFPPPSPTRSMALPSAIRMASPWSTPTRPWPPLANCPSGLKRWTPPTPRRYACRSATPPTVCS